MLDSQMIEQLKQVFGKLENPVELVYGSSVHEKQAELIDMLTAVAGTSDLISTRASDETTSLPQFAVHYKGQDTGVSIVGIPGGHEFTSLILAILNVDGKGKLPDTQMINRIKNINGPIEVKTYISLSCENCPDVVQALNQMAYFHPNMKHQMIDGGLAQEEIQRLGIQGVPSVVSGDKLISVGKAGFLDLLQSLEDTYGSDKSGSAEPVDLGEFDVVVIGAGPAGASSAIYSARKGLKTLVIAEKFGGQVQDTKGIENLISVPYTEGPQLAAQLAKHMQEYDIQMLEHRRVQTVIGDGLKRLELDSGEFLKAKSLIVATGAKWRELGIPGEKEYIGRGVAFCPHCDGPFYKGKDVAVVGGGNSGVEAAIDLAGIVKSVVLIEFAPELKADEVLVKKLRSLPNVKVIKNARTSQVVGNGEKVVGLEYEDRGTEEIKQL
ncbi:MAG: alkyl hydroperoxide reductase subunit F, partial [Bdellovibrionales bacterium]|nr:alkyl hydroperoxide reductase subunit F [Bdellovibrionales bacterium]